MSSILSKKAFLLLVVAFLVITALHFLHRDSTIVTRLRLWDAKSASSVVRVYAAPKIECQFHFPIAIPGWGSSKICTYDPKDDREISRFVKNTHRAYSAGDVKAVIDILKAEVAEQPGSASEWSLVDVGCNIGLFTLSAALNGYNVLAVDAMDSSLQLVATSVALANVTSRVTLIHNAISDKHGDVIVEVRVPNNIGASWVLHENPETKPATGISQRTTAARTVVQAICLDDLIPYVTSRKVFLKIDIEGSEWRALHCADKFFAAVDVRYIHMEWLFYGKTDAAKGDDIINYLTSRDFTPTQAELGGQALDINSQNQWPGNVLWVKM